VKAMARVSDRNWYITNANLLLFHGSAAGISAGSSNQ
jgi:hypothetical protein